MIRYVKHGKCDYIVIDGSFQINDIKAPIQVQINVTGLSNNERLILYKSTSVAFNRNIDVTKKQDKKPLKPWWKIF